MYVWSLVRRETSLARPPISSWVGIRFSVVVYGIRPSRRVPQPPSMEGVGARRGPGIPSVTTATEEGPVVCSEAPLARPPVCPSGGGVWWVPGASAPHPSHSRYFLHKRHWFAMFAVDHFP